MNAANPAADMRAIPVITTRPTPYFRPYQQPQYVSFIAEDEDGILLDIRGNHGYTRTVKPEAGILSAFFVNDLFRDELIQLKEVGHYFNRSWVLLKLNGLIGNPATISSISVQNNVLHIERDESKANVCLVYCEFPEQKIDVRGTLYPAIRFHLRKHLSESNDHLYLIFRLKSFGAKSANDYVMARQYCRGVEPYEAQQFLTQINIPRLHSWEEEKVTYYGATDCISMHINVNHLSKRRVPGNNDIRIDTTDVIAHKLLGTSHPVNLFKETNTEWINNSCFYHAIFQYLRLAVKEQNRYRQPTFCAQYEAYFQKSRIERLVSHTLSFPSLLYMFIETGNLELVYPYLLDFLGLSSIGFGIISTTVEILDASFPSVYLIPRNNAEQGKPGIFSNNAVNHSREREISVVRKRVPNIYTSSFIRNHQETGYHFSVIYNDHGIMKEFDDNYVDHGKKGYTWPNGRQVRVGDGDGWYVTLFIHEENPNNGPVNAPVQQNQQQKPANLIQPAPVEPKPILPVPKGPFNAGTSRPPVSGTLQSIQPNPNKPSSPVVPAAVDSHVTKDLKAYQPASPEQGQARSTEGLVWTSPAVSPSTPLQLTASPNTPPGPVWRTGDMNSNNNSNSNSVQLTGRAWLPQVDALQRDMDKKMFAHCYVLPDIRGSFNTLVRCLRSTIADYVSETDSWSWKAPPRTTIICLGMYIHDPRVDRISTYECNVEDARIIGAFKALRRLAMQDGGEFVALVGPTELQHLLVPEKQTPFLDNLYDASLRYQFIDEQLIPFVLTQGLMVSWADYTFVSGGLDVGWFARHDKVFPCRTISQFNSLFQKRVRDKQWDRIKPLLEPDSPIYSQRIIEEPRGWLLNDYPLLQQTVLSHLIPKLIIGGDPNIGTYGMRNRLLTPLFHAPQVAPNSIFLALSGDQASKDWLYIVYHRPSDAPNKPGAPLPPCQLLHFKLTFNVLGTLMYHETDVVVK